MTSPPRRGSLRRRLLQRLLLPLLVVLVASGGFTFWLSLYFANKVYDGWLYDSANSLALLVDRVGDHATCDLPVAAEEIFVWDETDSTFFSVRGDHSGVLASNAQLPTVPPDADRYRDAFLFQRRVGGKLIHVVGLELSAERAGEHVWVQVAETNLKRQRLARTILFAVLAPQVMLILATFVAVNYGVRQGLKPLRLITRTLALQEPTALRTLPDGDVPEEVLPLTRSINTLLEGLQSLLTGQRKFIADAAHQLRTPLTAIRLNIDRALGEDAERSRAILLQLRASAERASRLANQLLSLARVESGTKLPLADRVDLVRLARESGAEWVPRALDRNVELSLVAPETMHVRGDTVLLGEIIDNLLDNAIKYHPGGGHVTVEIESVPAADGAALARLVIEDDGPGIPPELHQRVFERFYRGDRSGHSGTGLGLPIVKEIAVAHGGSVRLEQARSGQGLRTVVELPAI